MVQSYGSPIRIPVVYCLSFLTRMITTITLLLLSQRDKIQIFCIVKILLMEDRKGKFCFYSCLPYLNFHQTSHQNGDSYSSTSNKNKNGTSKNFNFELVFEKRRFNKSIITLI